MGTLGLKTGKKNKKTLSNGYQLALHMKKISETILKHIEQSLKLKVKMTNLHNIKAEKRERERETDGASWV